MASDPTGLGHHSGAMAALRHEESPYYSAPSADISHVALRHQAEDGRALSIDFSFTGGTFTAVSVYAPCVPAQRAAYFTHTLLPSLPADRQLLVGGDFNCVAGQLDVLGPDNAVIGPHHRILRWSQDCRDKPAAF